MKIFAMYTTVTLTQKPEWLDVFLEKYQPRDLHVTLKQPCFIEEGTIDNLKEKISRFFTARASGHVNIVFDTLVYNTEESGAIMICARNAGKLIQLQKDLCITLSEYKHYVEPIREEYENNFRPHITIGDEIPQEQYKKALSSLKDDCRCEGMISEVVLAIVNDMSTEESSNPSNKMIYQL